MNPNLHHTLWLFRAGLGLGALLAGLDKFFNQLTQWDKYLSPLLERILPVEGAVFMAAVGVIEMAVGAAILAGFTRLGGYVMAAWLAAIALSLAAAGMFLDVAVRDMLMALGAYAMARLSEVRQEAAHGARRAVSGQALS